MGKDVIECLWSLLYKFVSYWISDALGARTGCLPYIISFSLTFELY